MDELALAAAKLHGQLSGRKWYRGVELGTDRDGKPALHVTYRGPLNPAEMPGPIGFIDDFPVFLRVSYASEFTGLADRCEV